MIIIKMIILYFIQITHTDDFPSTDIRLALIIYYGLRFAGLLKSLYTSSPGRPVHSDTNYM